MRDCISKKYYETNITENIINDFIKYIFNNKNEILKYVDNVDKPRLLKLYQFLNYMKNNDSNNFLLNKEIKRHLISPSLIIKNNMSINFRHIHSLFEYYISKKNILIDYTLYLLSYNTHTTFYTPYYNLGIYDDL